MKSNQATFNNQLMNKINAAASQAIYIDYLSYIEG